MHGALPKPRKRPDRRMNQPIGTGTATPSAAYRALGVANTPAPAGSPGNADTERDGA